LNLRKKPEKTKVTAAAEPKDFYLKKNPFKIGLHTENKFFSDNGR
jgi:hypothetical protein